MNLYICTACKEGRHADCEGVTLAPDGHYGDKRCICMHELHAKDKPDDGVGRKDRAVSCLSDLARGMKRARQALLAMNDPFATLRAGELDGARGKVLEWIENLEKPEDAG